MDDLSIPRHADGAPFDPQAYAVVVEPLSKEDGGGWLATIPDLPGCMGDGKTEIEAIADVRSAALCWADGAEELKRGIPKPSFPAGQTLVAAE